MKIVQKITKIINYGIRENGSASLIVSGGSSLLKIFSELSKVALDWDKVFVGLVDDRLVPKKSMESNEFLIKRKLLVNKAKLAKFIPLNESNLEEISQLLPFDLILMGMGHDGHFASIFPDMLGQEKFVGLDSKPAVYSISRRGVPFVPRITMNLALILKSRNIFLVVSDTDKKIILEKSMIEEKYPVHWLLNQNKILVKIFESLA